MKGNYDVVLVQPNIVSPYKVGHLPFGPLLLAPKLREAGYEVLIFDSRVDKQSKLENAVKNSDLLFVGFSVFTGPIISSALELAAKIRKLNPEIPLVWGGAHPTILPRQTIKHPLVDILVRGEGEFTLVELANALKNNANLADVQGLTYKRNGDVLSTPDRPFFKNFDENASMALDLIDLKKYIFNHDGLDTIHIITSRGCPYRCSFCWNLLFFKRLFRCWSPEKIKKEIQPFLDAGVGRIVINDNFLGNTNRILSMGNMFKELGLAWAIEDGFRVDVHNTKELFKALKDTNCHHVSFGAESGSQRILDMISKDIKVDQILQSAKLGHEYEVGVKYAWMVGLPNETKDDVIKTVKLIDKINETAPGTPHAVSFFSPYPGSNLYQLAVDSGWKPPESFEGWAYFREEMTYPYLDDMWFYKSVMYSNFFIHAINSDNAIWKKTKGIYTIPFKFLSKTANIRWKTRRFEFPLEYMFGEYARKFLRNKLEA